MTLHFEDYEIDPRAFELRRRGSRVELAPMAVRVLLHLVRHADRMVERNELYESLWPDGGVDRERLLNTYIRQIRLALGERAGENRYIRTYPRRGYRFVGQGAWGASDPAPAEAGIPSSDGRRVRAVALLMLVAVLWMVGRSIQEDAGSEEPPSIPYELGEELLSAPSAAARASAAAHFRRAIALDPDHAGAHSGLAVSLFWAGDAAGAARAARSALTLSPADGRAHLALGSALLQSQWAWTDAERHLRSAARASVGDPQPRVALAFLLTAAGRAKEARTVLDEAARLEPTAAAVTGELGMLYGWLGDAEAALVFCQRTIAVEPRAAWGHECALDAAMALGDSTEVVARSASLVQLLGGDEEVVFANTENMEGRLRAWWAYLVEKSEATSKFETAMALAQLGQIEPALRALGEAVDDREAGVPALAVVPAFRHLVGDPRYDELVRQVGGADEAR